MDIAIVLLIVGLAFVFRDLVLAALLVVVALVAAAATYTFLAFMIVVDKITGFRHRRLRRQVVNSINRK